MAISMSWGMWATEYLVKVCMYGSGNTLWFVIRNEGDLRRRLTLLSEDMSIDPISVYVRPPVGRTVPLWVGDMVSEITGC